MDQTEAQALLQKFAAPLASYAAVSQARKESAERLVQSLWIALIAGPEMEEETWKVFKNQANLDDDLLQSIKDIYFQKMKPVVSEEQLAGLRERYRRKEKGNLM